MFEPNDERELTLCLISVMGKAEGRGENWHGHVTALTVAPDYRRLGLAATLMNFLEDVSEKYYFPSCLQIFEIRASL